MTKISTSVTIDAPIKSVKKVFFDFAAYPTWNSFVTSIKGDSTNVGDYLEIEVSPPGKSKQTFKPQIVEKSDTKFGWRGTLLSSYIFSGVHTFTFVSNGTTTKVIQEEEFSGLLSGPLLYFITESTQKGFSNMNSDLKKKVESLI